MELKLLNEQGQAGANVAAADTVFGRDYNEALIHQIVVAYAANARSGNRKQKDREEVSHTTKKYRAGICSILSQLAREGRLSVIENLSIEAPKTKLLSQKLQGMGLDSVLVITDTLDENLMLASRNLPNVLIVEPRHADPMSLVFYKKILVTKPALAKIEEMFA